MKLNINDFKKIKEDKNTITLHHPRHGHKIDIAKNSLSQKLKSDFAAMPIHKADGGGVSEENPQEPGFLDKISNLISPPTPESSGQATTPEQAAMQKSYNSAENAKRLILGPKGGNIFGESSDRQDFLFGPNGEPPKQVDPEVAIPVKNLYDAEKNKARMDEQAATQATYKKAIENNQARQAMGLQPEQLPPQPVVAPPVDPRYQRTNFQNPDQMQTQMSPEVQNQMSAANDQAMTNYMKGYGEQKAGIEAEARAKGVLGEQTAAIAKEQQQKEDNFMKHYQESNNTLNEKRQGIVDLYKTQTLKPNQYLENMSTAGRINTALGIIFGGAGAAAAGQSNMAMDILNKQIDRDIQSQVNAQGQTENLFRLNQQDFGNMNDAMAATRINMMDIYKTKIDEVAAKNASPMAQAKAQQLKGQLDIQMAPLQQQLALRQAAFRGIHQGNVDPAMIIQYAAPEHDRDHLMKELGEMQGSVKAGDNLRSAFDQLSKINTAENHLMHPYDTPKQVNAIIGSVIPGLSKETAGRFTEQDASYLEDLMPKAGESEETQKLKKQRMESLVNEKLNFPSLAPYGIRPTPKYKSSSSFNLAPPVRK